MSRSKKKMDLDAFIDPNAAKNFEE